MLALWSGLGYYRRARMLHKAAQFVAAHLGGNLPAQAEDLRALPGIGAYTAAAVASIEHGEPVAVVDGNVERVLCRLAGWEAGSRKGGGAALRRKIEDLAGGRATRTRQLWSWAQRCARRAIRNARCVRWPLIAKHRANTRHRNGRR